MFDRLATARMKAAQDALATGRWEEAMEIVLSRDLADQRKARMMRKDLATAFLRRGQERLLGRQFDLARRDFDHADRCGADASLLAEWRLRMVRAVEEDQAARAAQQTAERQARERLAYGSIAGAADAAALLPDHHAAAQDVHERIERQARRAEESLAAANKAIDENQVELAVQHLQTVRTNHAKLDGLAKAEGRVITLVIEKARRSFQEGRADRAEIQIAMLRTVGQKDARRIELENVLRLARDAAEAVSRESYTDAAMLLGRIEQLGYEGSWLRETRNALTSMDEGRRRLLEGPLGLLHGLKGSPTMRTMHDPCETHASPVRGIVRKVTPPALEPAPASDGLPRRMLLRIDGVGSFFLLRGDRISIGRAGPGATADLTLMSDIAMRQAEIVRADEDYFVISSGGVELAGRPVDHALLQDQDRIRLGARVRMKFLKPSLKSASAVLELGEGVQTQGDCRRVILWSGPLLLGGTRECHIPIRGASTNVILVARDGHVILREMAPSRAFTQLVMDEQSEFAGMRMSLRVVSNSTDVGRVAG